MLGTEFWYRYFWKPREPSAWAYEIVRAWPQAEASMPREMAKELRTLHPYPKLSLEQKQCLQAVIQPQYLSPVPSSGSRSRPGYTEPLPLLSFDLARGKKHALRFIAEWYETQKRLQGISRVMREKGLTRNRDQTHKLGDWSLVEVLTEEQTKSNKDKRRYAIACARRFQPLVRIGLHLASISRLAIPGRVPVIPELIGKTCTTDKMLDALTKACRGNRR